LKGKDFDTYSLSLNLHTQLKLKNIIEKKNNF